MKLIVGLGNPGQEYNNTRHNIGFMVIDNYLSKENCQWQSKFNAQFTSLTVNGEKNYFLKPQTYMNLSGEAISKFANYYKIAPQDILIIHDDLDLPIAKIRLKINSSAGGHNGIKSIINCLGTNSFARLKIGISNNHNYDTKDYVLGHFTSSEQVALNNIYPTVNNIINDFFTTDINTLMNKYNGAR